MKNAITLVWLFFVAFSGAEQCRWGHNHLYYSIENNSTDGDLVPNISVSNCIRRALHIYENSVPGYFFNNVESYIYEQKDFEVVFIDFRSQQYPMKPSLTKLNCSDGATQTGTIYLNTNFNFTCMPWTTRNDPDHYGVNLFSTMLREIGFLLGLETNDDPTSIMYRHMDNFDYMIDNTSLNKADRSRLARIYIY